MIEVKNLSKHYGSFVALDAISFQAAKGQITALLGPNGAGKTTTMKIITGFLNPTGGQVLIGEQDLSRHRLNIQKKIGYLPENAPLYPELSVDEHLDLALEIHNIYGEEAVKHKKKVLQRCALEDRRYFLISELSKGYKQRVALAQAIIHDPEILVLDEPTTGLDPNQIADIRALIKDLGKNKTIILSTHIMQEVEAMADQVVLIDHGKIVVAGSTDTIRSTHPELMCFRLVIKGKSTLVKSCLSKVKTIVETQKVAEVEKGVFQYLVSAESDIRRDLNKAILANEELELWEMSLEKQSMEDIFHQLTNFHS
ncbi:MAG TPA: ATP-binding cassette domain-containing protein [Candidatus Gracilibacteria bacterium]|nr:ATP-binding cassette domain-containing protein [Candidatus Gracilibacteria bacterium]